MNENILKIVYNPTNQQYYYQLKSETGDVFNPVSERSELYRCYRKLNMKEDCRALVQRINELYNKKNNGLCIILEGGDSECCEYLKKAVSELWNGGKKIKFGNDAESTSSPASVLHADPTYSLNPSDTAFSKFENKKPAQTAVTYIDPALSLKNLVSNDSTFLNSEKCESVSGHNVFKIAVIGEEKSGKSCLIKGMDHTFPNHDLTRWECNDWVLFKDKVNYIEWYEMRNNDLDRTFQKISGLISDGLSAVIYCVHAPSKFYLSASENNFIIDLKKEFPSLSVVIALTECLDKKEVAMQKSDEITKLLGPVKAVPLLALEYTVDDDGKIIKKPYGLEVLAKYTFEKR